MIRGYFAGDSPFVAASVSFRDLPDLTGEVEFLVDTGSAVTVLQFPDLERLGIDVARHFAGRPVEHHGGVGGVSRFLLAVANLDFDDSTGSSVRYRFPVRLAAEPSAIPLPSVLGMDFLGLFDLRIARQSNVVSLEPPSG